MQRCLTCKERVHVHIYLSIELLKNINRNIICNWNFIPLSQLYQNELRLIISFIFHFYIIFFNSCEMCCIDVRVCLVKKLNWKTRMEFILIISGYGHSGIVDFPREADEAWKRLWRGIWDCQELLYALQAQLLVVASQRWAITLRATDEPSYCQFMNCIRICIYDVRWWRTPICAVPFRLVIIYEVALFQLVNSFSGEIFLSFRTARRDLNECSPPLHVLVSGHFW